MPSRNKYQCLHEFFHVLDSGSIAKAADAVGLHEKTIAVRFFKQANRLSRLGAYQFHVDTVAIAVYYRDRLEALAREHGRGC